MWIRFPLSCIQTASRTDTNMLLMLVCNDVFLNRTLLFMGHNNLRKILSAFKITSTHDLYQVCSILWLVLADLLKGSCVSFLDYPILEETTHKLPGATPCCSVSMATHTEFPTSWTLTCVWRTHMDVHEHVCRTMPEWLSMYAWVSTNVQKVYLPQPV